MSRPRVTFAELRQMLLDMGFTENVVPRSHVFFAHQPSGAEVALPIGGLMSDKPAASIAAEVEHLEHIAAAELGVSIGTPFMHLSFLGLSVIPELRITDRGLVDVDRFALTSVSPG